MTVHSLPDPLSSRRPPEGAAAARRGDVALDHFFARRRSATIGAEFWTAVAGRWPGFNPIERMRWARAFSRYRPYWTPDVLAPADRAFYDRLPETFTAYRGQNGVELSAGGAFTLDRDVARGHALGRRSISYADPTVISLRLAKADVALAFAARGEGEIVLFPTLWNVLRPNALQCARVAH